MEDLVNFYSRKKVLLTGCSGYIGSHIGLFLVEIGCEVYGISRKCEPGIIFSNSDICTEAIKCDLTNLEELSSVFRRIKPEIVIHLGGVADVGFAKNNPLICFNSNIVGTLNLLEVSRKENCVKSIVIVSTMRSRIEDNLCKSKDPYSVSKSCINMIFQSYNETYFKNGFPNVSVINLSNVMGGGDLSFKRLLPKSIKKWAAGEKIVLDVLGLEITFVHMLDVFFSILKIGRSLWCGMEKFNGKISYIFPDEVEVIEDIVRNFGKLWDGKKEFLDLVEVKPNASKLSKKSSIKLREDEIGLISKLSYKLSLELTIEWYKNYFKDMKRAKAITLSQLTKYRKMFEIT